MLSSCNRETSHNDSVYEVALTFLSKLNFIFYRLDILSKVVFPDPKNVLNILTQVVRCSHALRTSNEDAASTLPHCMQSGEGLHFRDFGQVNPNFWKKPFPRNTERVFLMQLIFLSFSMVCL